MRRLILLVPHSHPRITLAIGVLTSSIDREGSQNLWIRFPRGFWAGCRPKCRLNVGIGEGSQILICFGGRAGCRGCFKYYICISVSILPLNIYTYES